MATVQDRVQVIQDLLTAERAKGQAADPQRLRQLTVALVGLQGQPAPSPLLSSLGGIEDGTVTAGSGQTLPRREGPPLSVGPAAAPALGSSTNVAGPSQAELDLSKRSQIATEAITPTVEDQEAVLEENPLPDGEDVTGILDFPLEEAAPAAKPTVRPAQQVSPTPIGTAPGLERPVTADPTGIPAPVGVLGKLASAAEQNPQMSLRLLEILGTVGTGLAANRNAGKIQKRMDRSQAKANLLNTLSQANVAAPAPVSQAPDALTTIAGGVTAGAASARQQLEREEALEMENRKIDATIAKKGFRKGPNGELIAVPKGPDPERTGDVFRDAGKASAFGTSLEDYLSSNVGAKRLFNGSSQAMRDAFRAQFELGQRERGRLTFDKGQEGAADSGADLGEQMGALQAQTGQAVDFFESLKHNPLLKEAYDAANRAGKLAIQAGYFKGIAANGLDLPEPIEELAVLAKGLGTNFPNAKSLGEAVQLMGNEAATKQWKGADDIARARMQGEFMIARSAALEDQGKGISSAGAMQLTSVDAFISFLEGMEKTRFGKDTDAEGKIVDTKPLTGWTGNWAAFMGGLLGDGAKSRFMSDTFAYESSVSMLTAMTAQMLNGNRVSDQDFRVAAMMVPQRNIGDDATKAQFARLMRLAKARKIAIENNFDPSFTAIAAAGGDFNEALTIDGQPLTASEAAQAEASGDIDFPAAGAGGIQ